MEQITLKNKSKIKDKNGLTERKRKELIFYIIMLTFPVVQVAIFYFGVNFNSILLAFKKYDFDVQSNTLLGYTWSGFDNFVRCLSDMTGDYVFLVSLKNSFIAFGVQIFISTSLALLFSLYIYQKKPFSTLFRIFLFLPSVISPLVIVIMFKNIMEEAIPAIWLQLFDMHIDPVYSANKMISLLFYYVWTSFGTSVLLYTSSMSSIDDSIIEAARIDGASSVKEFIYIILPLIYPTITTFITVNVATVFTNQLNLFAFERGDADYSIYTYGYYLFMETAKGGNYGMYPYLSAMGLILTVVSVPVTLLIRYGMLKLGPSEE